MFPSFTRRLAGPTAALLFSANAVALAASPVPAQSVQIVCTPDMSANFCAALHRAAAASWPQHIVQIVDTPVPDRWAIGFRQLLDRPDYISGHLTWSDATGRSGKGPTLNMSVMDQKLSADTFDHFAQDLLRITPLPL